MASSGTEAINPRVFVGLPVYNGEKYLRASIESVLAQELGDLQLTISDNESNDSTQAICLEYAAADSRIHYIRQKKNLGALGNFSYLKSISTGDYFTWMAADDVWPRNRLGEIVKFLDQHQDVVGCASDVECIDELGKVFEVWKLTCIYETVDWPNARRSFFRLPASRAFMAIYGVFRTSFIRRFELPELLTARQVATGVDQIFIASLVDCGRIVALPQPLIQYRRHCESVHLVESTGVSRWHRINLEMAIASRLLKIISTMHVAGPEKLRLIQEVASGFAPHTRLKNYLTRSYAKLKW